jgi:acyl-CoA synthetase (AMP-forming)/AMP-acid ligase II
MDVATKLGQLARWRPDRIAIVDDTGSWSFRQLYARIRRVGNALHGLGLRKGDRVGLLIPDIREYLEVDYGTMAAGLVRVPIDPRLTRSELIGVLQHAGARALVTHGQFAEKVEGLAAEVEGLERIVGIGSGVGLGYETLLAKSSEQPLPECDASDLATLNFSGGTTGTPKAIMLTHGNLVAVAQNTIHGFDIPGDAVFLNVRPLWPIAQVILMSHLFAGATVVLGGRFEPEDGTARIAAAGATRTSLVPTQLVRWLEHLRDHDARLERLQAIYVGGSRIPPAVFERALACLGPRIGVLYGMTEAPVTCYLKPSMLDADAETRRGLMQSVGHELFGYQVRIAGKEGPSAAAGVSGEVLMRSRAAIGSRRQRADRCCATAGSIPETSASSMTQAIFTWSAGSMTSSAPAARRSFRRKWRT